MLHLMGHPQFGEVKRLDSDDRWGPEAHFPLESLMQLNQALDLTTAVEDNLEFLIIMSLLPER